jgi:glutaredoxin
MKPNVQILTGGGCSACKAVEKMLDEMEIEYELIDLTENPEIIKKYMLLSVPGIVIDGKLEFTGVPKREELRKKLGR